VHANGLHLSKSHSTQYAALVKIFGRSVSGEIFVIRGYVVWIVGRVVLVISYD